MGLIDAIANEVDGDFAEAVSDLESVSEIGSTLDKAGIWDALARVHLKMGHHKQAAEWQVQAARAFLELDEEAMPRDEAMYQALTRFRAAFANWSEDPAYRDGVMKEYGLAFDRCWKAFPGGITHEALFYARALQETDDPARAAAVYEDVAALMEEELPSPEEVGEEVTEAERSIVRDVWRAAAKAHRAAGDEEAAGSALGKVEELGGELPGDEGDGAADEDGEDG